MTPSGCPATWTAARAIRPVFVREGKTRLGLIRVLPSFTVADGKITRIDAVTEAERVQAAVILGRP